MGFGWNVFDLWEHLFSLPPRVFTSKSLGNIVAARLFGLLNRAAACICFRTLSSRSRNRPCPKQKNGRGGNRIWLANVWCIVALFVAVRPAVRAARSLSLLCYFACAYRGVCGDTVLIGQETKHNTEIRSPQRQPVSCQPAMWN